MGKMLLSLLLLCNLSAKAQQVHNITTDAQYFDPETLEFFTRLENGKHTRSYLVVEVNREGKYTVTLTERRDTIHLGLYLKHVGKTGNTFINLKELKKSPTGYTPQLGNMLFEWSYGNSLRIINPQAALIRMRWDDEDGGSSSTFSFEPYAAISINNALSVYCIAHNDYNYHIVHTGTDFMTYPNQEGKTATLKTDEDITPLLRQHYPFTELFEVNGKQGLKSFDNILVPAVYDKIVQTHFNHTIARKGSEIDLYYKNGDRIDITGIRAVQYNLHNISILKGNEVYWVARDGDLLKEPSYELTDDFYYQPTSSPQPYTEIVAIDGNWILHAMFYVKSDTKIISQDAFKAVTFTNGSTRTEGYALSPTLIAETTDGQKALLDNNDIQYTVVLGPGDYTFSYDEHWKFVLFEKDALKGSWPQNKDVRYTKLDNFDKGFARFTLPDGTRGWLAKDGTEYLDQ